MKPNYNINEPVYFNNKGIIKYGIITSMNYHDGNCIYYDINHYNYNNNYIEYYHNIKEKYILSVIDKRKKFIEKFLDNEN